MLAHRAWQWCRAVYPVAHFSAGGLNQIQVNRNLDCSLVGLKSKAPTAEINGLMGRSAPAAKRPLGSISESPHMKGEKSFHAQYDTRSPPHRYYNCAVSGWMGTQHRRVGTARDGSSLFFCYYDSSIQLCNPFWQKNILQYSFVGDHFF